MRLEWADFNLEPRDGVVDGPVWDDVRSLVEHLGRCADGFIILGTSDQTYIQTARVPQGLIVEHQQGSVERHFALDENPVDAERACELFRAFFERSDLEDHADWSKVKV